MIKTEQKVEFLMGFQLNFMKTLEQGSFLSASQNEWKKSYATIKTKQKVRFLSGF